MLSSFLPISTATETEWSENETTKYEKSSYIFVCFPPKQTNSHHRISSTLVTAQQTYICGLTPKIIRPDYFSFSHNSLQDNFLKVLIQKSFFYNDCL